MTAIGELVGAAMFLGFIAFVVIIVIRKRKGLNIDFKQVPFKDTTFKPLMENVRTNGTRVKDGTLHFGFNAVHHVIRYCELKGNKPQLAFDKANNIFLDTGKKTEHNLICFEIADGFIRRKLGIGNELFLLDRDKMKFKYDSLNFRWFLPSGITWYSFGDIWIADYTSKDFVKDLSMAFFDESVQTHLINGPNRVVALDMNHAMKLSLIRESVEAEKGRYQLPAPASETRVEEAK